MQCIYIFDNELYENGQKFLRAFQDGLMMVSVKFGKYETMV